MVLDFEKPIVELEAKLNDMKKLASESDVNVNEAVSELEKKIKKAKKSKKSFKSTFKENVSNDDLIRWILIGLAIIVGIAVINLLGGLLGGVLGIILLIVAIWLVLSLLDII